MGKAFVSGGMVMTAPVPLPALSTIAVGSSVYLNENGSPVEYLVVHQGLPSSMYDASCEGTWLLRRDCYENRVWHSSDVNIYSSSTIHSYLNNDFFNLLDVSAQNSIKQAKIPYINGSGYGTLASGSNGLSAKVFLLSCYEVGFTTDDSYVALDGGCLSYFNGASDSKRVAYVYGTASLWWLRSPRSNYQSYAHVVSKSGTSGTSGCATARGIRPALILPSTVLVDTDGTIKL